MAIVDDLGIFGPSSSAPATPAPVGSSLPWDFPGPSPFDPDAVQTSDLLGLPAFQPLNPVDDTPLGGALPNPEQFRPKDEFGMPTYEPSIDPNTPTYYRDQSGNLRPNPTWDQIVNPPKLDTSTKPSGGVMGELGDWLWGPSDEPNPSAPASPNASGAMGQFWKWLFGTTDPSIMQMAQAGLVFAGLVLLFKRRR